MVRRPAHPVSTFWTYWSLFVAFALVVPCKAQDDEFIEFYDPDEVEVESLIHREPVRDMSFNDFEQPMENESEDLDHESIRGIEPDDEEFEGFIPRKAESESGDPTSNKPLLKVAKVPPTFRSLEHYVFEMFFLAFIFLYLVNYMHGRATNSRLAAAWFAAHENLLSTNFSMVGDDTSATPEGNQERETSRGGEKSSSNRRLIRESDSLYTLWCSGRVACTGMMVELRLMKRQDLPSLFLHWLHRPKSGVNAATIASDDRVVVKVVLEDGEMDTWVMAVGVKKSITMLAKDHFDLATYPVDRRGQRFNGVPEGMIVLSEIAEATATILNPTVLKVINDHQSAIEYIYISDQYSGPKASMEELKPPKPEEIQKVLIFSFILDEKDVEAMKPLFNFVFYLTEKTRKLRLGKEAKAKSDRARTKVSETLLKSVQAARQEAAQNRRDEQRRAVKERIMTEEDPEKARRLEEREQKRENRKRQQRIKMVKMKGM
ncbi:Coiled-coil domain-containing protein 47 [Echinococcus granulosus]|uniref:PAT complex subunit CCDC47 n=1 Tax=Echinococcus granulosus TaxID=6210 RepID=W6UBP1_ECHGR|nr:Coiled-coil domain-containing protein 47 [Echinococcus granulosus]EUB58525.1 Coiled-coil domain-containing protein 47 [Echinococcus granulosus]